MKIAKPTKRRMLRLLARCGITAFFSAQVIIAIPHFENALMPLLTVPNISYADKMHIQWGTLFDLLDFVRRETPANAVILMQEDGRPEFDQYFLFPRRVIYGDAATLANNPQIEYVIVTDNYPQFPVNGDKKMMDATHGMFELRR